MRFALSRELYEHFIYRVGVAACRYQPVSEVDQAVADHQQFRAREFQNNVLFLRKHRSFLLCLSDASVSLFLIKVWQRAFRIANVQMLSLWSCPVQPGQLRF